MKSSASEPGLNNFHRKITNLYPLTILGTYDSRDGRGGEGIKSRTRLKQADKLLHFMALFLNCLKRQSHESTAVAINSNYNVETQFALMPRCQS